MKKLVLSIILILLLIFIGNTNVKANSWYTPDLTDYTFMIDIDDDRLIFKANELISGDFYAYLMRDYDFGVIQNPSGALDFSEIYNTLLWVVDQSLGVNKMGLIPMSLNGLPSFISYTVYNDFEPLTYKGAVNHHSIIYRLDFRGNYSLRINDNIYDSVYTLEVVYYIRINYTNNNYMFDRYYHIYWYDRQYMRYLNTYTEMDSDILHFELYNDSGLAYENGYTDGYDDGYKDGYDAGYDDGILLDQSEAYQEGFKDGQKSKLAENNEKFYSGIEKWLVPAIIAVILLGGFVSIAVRKRREE